MKAQRDDADEWAALSPTRLHVESGLAPLLLAPLLLAQFLSRLRHGLVRSVTNGSRTRHAPATHTIGL